MSYRQSGVEVIAGRRRGDRRRYVCWIRSLLAAVVLALFGNAATASPIAYYPLDTDTNDYDGVSPANNLTVVGTAPITNTAGNFILGTGAVQISGSSSTSNANNLLRILDANAASFDTTYTNFSLGLWMKPNDNWVNSTDRYITGKSGGSGDRGWFLRKNTSVSGISQLNFQYWNAVSGTNQSILTTFTAVPSTSEFAHVAVTYDGSGELRIYFNGILNNSAVATTTPLNGNNGANFELGGRGGPDRQQGAWYDDYGLRAGNAAIDTASAQEIALTHGLGRMAGVALGTLKTDSTTVTQIADVLSAYVAGPGNSAMAGTGVAEGTTWYYGADVDPAVTNGSIGTIGGSVAGGDAFIVLGSDGSGVTLVPEPSEIILCVLGVFGVVSICRRNRVEVN